MHRLLAVLPCSLLLSACASRSVSDSVVESWAQRPDERGQLAVGKVASIERKWFQVDRPPTQTETLSTGGAAIVPLAIYLRNTGWMYEHLITMKDGSSKRVGLSFTYKLGQCIAFRPGLGESEPLAIAALPGECGQ
jgi:hypothetical protein